MFFGSRSAMVLSGPAWLSSTAGSVAGGAAFCAAWLTCATGDAPATTRPEACWVPIIQPTISPNNAPATAKTIDSVFMMSQDPDRTRMIE